MSLTGTWQTAKPATCKGVDANGERFTRSRDLGPLELGPCPVTWKSRSLEVPVTNAEPFDYQVIAGLMKVF